MKALWTFAESPFENPKISSAELFAYTTDHLERMKSGNADGKLDERIAVTAAAFVAFRDTATADQITLGSRKSRKFRDDSRGLIRGVGSDSAGSVPL